LIGLTFVSNIVLCNTLIPFDFINGLILIEAEVDGKTGNFILDSGSNGVLLNSKSSKSDVSYQTLSGIAEGSEQEIEALRVGNFESRDLLGFATDLSNLEVYLSRSISGIIGSTVFNPSSLTIDFGNNLIVISNESISDDITKNLTPLAYEVVNDLPVAQIMIDGQPLHFILDSGASSHFIDVNALQATESLKPTGLSKTIFTAVGQTSAQQYMIDNVELGSKKSSIEVFNKDFRHLAETIDKPVVGLISLSALGDQVHFDVSSKTIFF